MKRAKQALCFLLATTLLMNLAACGGGKQDTPTWQEQYDLGVRYLSEGNYEEAIIAFTAAIEIDPMRPETYLDLAYAYIGQNDFDAAKEILGQGYELTGDERLKAKLEEIENGNITDYWGNVRKMSAYDENGTLIWYHLYDYAPDGTKTTATSYDGTGRQTGHVDLVYSESGEILVNYHWGSYTGAIGRVEAEYENGNRVKETWCAEDGTLMFYVVNEFDYAGNMIRAETYDANEALNYYRIFEYDGDGNVIKESDYAPDGTLYGYCRYEYDSDGNCTKAAWYDDMGLLEESRIPQYDEQGNYLGELIYDGQGNLIGSTENES